MANIAERRIPEKIETGRREVRGRRNPLFAPVIARGSQQKHNADRQCRIVRDQYVAVWR
jgi:hypothetical protein